MTPTTGEVFQTITANNVDSYWRMNRGGEMGQIFSLQTDEHFHINAPPGDLRLWTTNIQRARLKRTVTNQTIGTFTSQDISGHFGLGPFSNGSVGDPFSKLHVDGGGANSLGYRPGMRQGLSATEAEDYGYFGLFPDPGSGSVRDAIICWSRKLSGTAAGSRLRFLYTGYHGSGATSSGTDGLELGLFQPDDTGDEGYFGVGNFHGFGITPDERIDVADKTIRLRNFMDPLPGYTTTSYENDALTRAVVVDPDDGRLYWREILCDWEINPIDDVVTAYLSGPLTGCPDETNMVGIGMDEPQAKLDVRKVFDNGFGTEIGIRSHMDLTAATKVAVEAINVEEASENFGLRSAVDGAERNWGLVSLTGAGFQGGSVVAGFFHADGEYITTEPIGVWGMSVNSFPTGGPGWAAWFDGYGYLSLGPWVTSDATLKQNIQPLVGCLDVVGAFAPKSFEFAVQDHPEMNLPEGFQAGIMAQDLQQVLPHLVRQAKRPGMTDSVGNVIAAPIDLLAVNYEGMIPYTIGAINEQQAIIVQLNERIETLEQQVAACCTNSGGDGQRSMSGGTGAIDVKHTDLFIIPNPVADLTQLRYTIAAPGRTRLEIADSQGKRVEVLEEAVREVGSFVYDWNTQDLAPGTYQCILYVNDAFVVKKAVKVGR